MAIVAKGGADDQKEASSKKGREKSARTAR
jgi:hypothetical protein